MSRHYGKWSGEPEEDTPDFQEQEKMKIKISMSGYIICVCLFLLGQGWHTYSPYRKEKECIICHQKSKVDLK